MMIVLRSRAERGASDAAPAAARRDRGRAVLVAILFSYAIARHVTVRSARSTTTMREMAASGDPDAPDPVPPNPRWQDEDARLLATTLR